MQYHGHNITATRYNFAIIGNDYEQKYQLVDTRNGNVLFQHDDEEECLRNIIKLSGVKEYDSKVIENFNCI